jgi:hypothetical protein
MDQLTTPDGNYLLIWPEVKNYNENKFKGPIPGWFKDLETNYTLSNTRRLTYPLQDPDIQINRHHKVPKIIIGSSHSLQQWTIHWSNTIKDIVIGKTIVQDSNNNSSITYIEHFIPYNLPPDLNLTPRRTPLILKACQGCSLFVKLILPT